MSSEAHYIFFTGCGRSGSTFTARMLDHASNCIARHEYMCNGEFSLQSRHLDEEIYAKPYLEKEKKRIESNFDIGTFIDSSTHLKNAVPALRSVFPGCTVYHLVRDPRKVVRSIYIRRSKNKTHEMPFDKDEIAKWLEGDKFYRCCWNWADWANKLLSQETKLVNFEKLVSSYAYLDEHVLQPNSIEMTEDVWQRSLSVKRKKTHSKMYRYLYARLKGKEFVDAELPEYEGWTTRQKQIFKDICGEAAGRCGYQL